MQRLQATIYGPSSPSLIGDRGWETKIVPTEAVFYCDGFSRDDPVLISITIVMEFFPSSNSQIWSSQAAGFIRVDSSYEILGTSQRLESFLNVLRMLFHLCARPYDCRYLSQRVTFDVVQTRLNPPRGRHSARCCC